MKLFMIRDTSPDGGFIVYDDKADLLFRISAESGDHMKYLIFDSSGLPVSTIRLNTLLLTYFTVRCKRHFYVLVPCLRDNLAFAIYGSTFRFAGDPLSGSFSAADSRGNILMTQKKCWAKTGEGYELELSDEDHLLFLISAAICADIFSSSNSSRELETGMP